MKYTKYNNVLRIMEGNPKITDHVDRLRKAMEKIADTEENRELRGRINRLINTLLECPAPAGIRKLRSYSTFGNGHNDKNC